MTCALCGNFYRILVLIIIMITTTTTTTTIIIIIINTVNSTSKAAMNMATSPNPRSSTLERFPHSRAYLGLRIQRYQ